MRGSKSADRSFQGEHKIVEKVLLLISVFVSDFFFLKSRFKNDYEISCDYGMIIQSRDFE